MTINERLAIVRIHLNKTQAEFASILGTDQSNLSKMEKNKVGVPIEALAVLFDRFDINLNWMICGVGAMITKKTNSLGLVEEPTEAYSESYRSKYIEVLEECRELNAELRKANKELLDLSQHKTLIKKG